MAERVVGIGIDLEVEPPISFERGYGSSRVSDMEDRGVLSISMETHEGFLPVREDNNKDNGGLHAENNSMLDSTTKGPKRMIDPGEESDMNFKKKRDDIVDELGIEFANDHRHAFFHDAAAPKATSDILTRDTILETTKTMEEGAIDRPDEEVDNSAEGDVEEAELEFANEEEEEETAATDIDEVNYFSAKSFTPEELAEIEPVVTKALIEPMGLAERGGYKAYTKFIQERELKRTKRNELQMERMQQALDDAAITDNPREYQRIFFEIAKTRNTIVNLGTGFGKTLIALLCIRHFSPDFEKGRQTLFLVPSVALAVQQSTTLRANLPKYTIQTAYYASSNSEVSRRALAEANVLVATHGAIHDLMNHYGDMFFMEKFNLLVIDECHYATGNHAYAVIMKKFYHTTSPDKRPRVLGLTASPLVNVKETHSDAQLAAMLGGLETLLDSKLISISGLRVAEDDCMPGMLRKSAEERVVYYHGRTNIARSFPSADNLPLHSSRYKEFRQLAPLYEDLGPLPLAMYAKTLARELSRNSYEQEGNLAFSRAVKHLTDIANFCGQECATAPNGGRTDKLMALEQLLEEQVETNGGAQAVGLVFVERRITAMALHNYFLHRDMERKKGTWTGGKEARHQSHTPLLHLSFVRDDIHDTSQFDDAMDDDPSFFLPGMTSIPQVRAYVPLPTPGADPMDQFSDADDQFNDAEDDVGIPFLDLSNRVENCPSVSGIAADTPDQGDKTGSSDTKNFRNSSIRSSVLVRNSTQIFKSLCMNRKLNEDEEELRKTWLHQETKVRDVLNQLRRGEINVLIATAVVEEGVDVQACSFVAVFDTLKNTKGYIQMKGRARQKSSKFFVFQDENSRSAKSKLSLKSAQEMEKRVHRFIETQSKQSAPPLVYTSCQEEVDAEQLHEELAALEAGHYQIECGAVDIQSAKSLLNRYTLSVPLDPFVRSSRESLLAHMPVYNEDTLILPSHLPRKVRLVHIPETRRRLPKKEKSKMMALMACVRLHSLGLLNDRLLPLTRKDMQAHVMRVATRELEMVSLHPPSVEKAFCDGDVQLYLYPIQQTSPNFLTYSSLFGTKGHCLALVTLEPIGEMPEFKMKHAEFGILSNSLGKGSVVTCTAEQRSILSQTFILLMSQRWRKRSRNMGYRMRSKDELSSMIAPYYVGVSSSEGQMDWDLMTLLLHESLRSINERTKAVHRASDESKLALPRLWSPIYDQHMSYISYGPSGETCESRFPHEKEGVVTYKDYFEKHRGFEVPAGSPLFDAQRLWHLPSNLPISHETSMDPPFAKSAVGRYEVCKELSSVKIAQEACCEAPLANASIALLCCMLPQFLFFFERCILVRAFIEHCIRHVPTLGQHLATLPIEMVATALTAKSCSLDDCYDKLEWFGDSVLKLVQTDTLLKSIELRQWISFLHEGDLSTLRSAMGSNDRLEKTCRHLRLENFIMTEPLARGQWIPGYLDFTDGTELKRSEQLRGKIFADLIESILGLTYLEFGYDVSLKVADELQVTLPWDDNVERQVDEEIAPPELLDTIGVAMGYKEFKRPELAMEAFTHPSALHPSVPSFQRLEWVGDAVLCLAAREWIYKTFPEKPLGDMVVMEAAVVNNETLAFLSVQNGLQHHLNHRDQSLPSRIETYDWSIRECGRGLWGADPPKVISDIVEAVLGAVHVDGGFSEGQKAVRHILRPVLGFLVANKDIDIKHPKKSLQEIGGELLELSVSREADFAVSKDGVAIWVGRQWGEADKEGSNYVASIGFMGSTLLAVLDVSALVARNRACAFMVTILEQNRELLSRFRAVRFQIETAMDTQGKGDTSEYVEEEGANDMV